MKRVEMDKRYTGIVMQLLNEGYSIFTEHMNGSQGEESKVVLKRDNHIMIVLMEREYTNCKTVYVIRIGSYKKDYHGQILWLHDFDYVDAYKFYRMNKNWFITPEEFDEIKNKLRVRDTYKYSKSKNEVIYLKSIPQSVMNHVHTIRGFKNVKPKDIVVYKTPNKYFITRKSDGKMAYAISR